MNPTQNRKSAEELDDALRLLDHELDDLQLDQPLQIRAIGGYALLKYGIREPDRALTADIDTMTEDYSAAVQRVIRTVAEVAGLDSTWINNDNLGDSVPEDIEAMYDARWQPQELGLRNIEVWLATVPTLTRAKIIAADTAEFSGREQDAPDLVRLLEHQGFSSMEQFAAAYPDPFDEYPAAYELVRDRFVV